MTNKIKFNEIEFTSIITAPTIIQNKISLDFIDWPKLKEKQKQFDLDLMVVQAKSRLQYGINANANFHLKQMKNEYTQLYQSYCLLYTSPSPRDRTRSRMPSSA